MVKEGDDSKHHDCQKRHPQHFLPIGATNLLIGDIVVSLRFKKGAHKAPSIVKKEAENKKSGLHEEGEQTKLHTFKDKAHAVDTDRINDERDNRIDAARTDNAAIHRRQGCRKTDHNCKQEGRDVWPGAICPRYEKNDKRKKPQKEPREREEIGRKSEDTPLDDP